MNPLFEAAVLVTEEAIINSLVVNASMTGADGNTVQALPHERLRALLQKYSPVDGPIVSGWQPGHRVPLTR